jgi:protein-disulfide isomerase
MARRGTRRQVARRPQAGRERARWRQVVDQWGGLPMLAGFAGILVVVIALVWVNRPGASGSGGDFVPLPRSEASGRVEGAADAPVRIIDFSDFQCSFCRRFARDTHPALLEEYVEQGRVSLEYRHAAILGPESVLAAEAAECALDQGAFWDMHDLLFLRQGTPNTGVFSTANLKRLAREVAEHREGFDVGAFDRCMDSREKRVLVEEMTLEAQALGVTSTPTFLIGREVIRGAQSIEVFREVIERQSGSRTGG